MSSQRQATAWRNRFIIATPLISMLASAFTLGPEGASTGGGLLGDFLPILLSSLIGNVSFWLCSALALFSLYWVLGRPLRGREVLDDLGVTEILDDAFGDIDSSADLDESEDADGTKPRTHEPTPPSNEAKENKKDPEEEREIDTPDNSEADNQKSKEAPKENASARETRGLRKPRSAGDAISSEEAYY